MITDGRLTTNITTQEANRSITLLKEHQRFLSGRSYTDTVHKWKYWSVYLYWILHNSLFNQIELA